MLLLPEAGEAQVALRFWDGSDPSKHRNGSIDGGSGTWSATEPSWTDSNGAVNGPMRPIPAFTIFQGEAGTVTIDDRDGAPAVTGMHFLVDGYRLTGGQLKLDGGPYTSIRSTGGATTRIDAELTGSGGVFFNDFGTVVLTGANSYQGTTRVDGGTLIGNTNSIRNNLENGGTVIFDQQQDGVFAGSVSGVFSFWGLMKKRGAGTLTLAGGNLLDWRVEEGALAAGATGFGGNVEIGASGRLTFDAGDLAGAETIYPYVLTGSGDFAVKGDSTLVLTGNSDFTGRTDVTGSRLRVDGALGGALHVGGGGVLAGSGRVGAVDVGSGGRLMGIAKETLHLDSLALGAGSIVQANFGAAGDPALFDVAGDLTLDGTLHVANTAALSDGIYRLFDYGGSLTDRGLALGTLPPGQDGATLSIQTATAGQVNLVSGTVTRPLQFWDGGDTTRHANGWVDGGPGTWRNGATNWTGQDGIGSEAGKANGFAIFTGNSGQVLIDNGAGPVAAGGLQFAVHGYVLSGGQLTLAGGDRTVIRVGAGGNWDSGMTAEIAAALTGTTTLAKRDEGTLLLSGVNSYVGDTEVEAGTLIGDTRSIRGNIRNAATLIFNQRDNGSFSGMIGALGSGAGIMVKRGSGVLTLTGASALDWHLEEGRLITAASRFTGNADLHQGAELQLDDAGSHNYAGRISGNGRLIKAGSGTLTLTGNSSGFAGDTQLRFGRLVVDSTLGGHLSVEANTVLGGRGILGHVRIAPGGTIAPGTGIRTLTVQGDLNLSSGSRYEVEVDPAGSAADRINVIGIATLGGTVAHIGAGGTYRPTSTYTILTAGGIQGRFDQVTSTYAFLTPRLGYTANAVTLTLDRNDVQFSQVAKSANQQATGAAMERLAAGNVVYDAVLMTDASSARGAFDRLSGEFHASLRAALIQNSSLAREATLDRLRGPAADQPGLAFWGQALDAWSYWRSDGNASRLEQSSSGGLVGVEMQAPDGGLRLGMMGGHNRDRMRGQGQADVDSYHAGVYGGGAIGSIALRGGLGVARQDVAAQRFVAFAGFSDGVAARYHATTAQAFGEAAYRIETADGLIEPFVNLAHIRLDVGRGQETGSAAALELEADRMRTSYATTGARGEMALALGSARFALRASAGWQHMFGDHLPVVQAALEGQRFAVAGLPIARNSLTSELRLHTAIADRVQISLGYQGSAARSRQNHSLQAGMNWRF
ncbi:autotransporter domain-containing protein [Sphingobium sp. BHU LFT2]|uniref:autotransporter domain-containing protein n=1 Tax=Sphingobium sp. BHU LFT2 TaxID=2807634 RepID=UPI00203506A4|nr:autotransporter domain-containing protein [Sphingobium sp. BHU LFT2]